MSIPCNCHCPQPLPLSGNDFRMICTSCGWKIQLEDKVFSLQKHLELERKDRIQLEMQLDKAVTAVEKLTVIAQQQQVNLTNMDKELSMIYKVLKITVIRKQRPGNCECQQLASAEVKEGSDVHHICVVCFKEVDANRIKNQKAVDESCRTANKENATTTVEMLDITDEADEIHRAVLNNSK